MIFGNEEVEKVFFIVLSDLSTTDEPIFSTISNNLASFSSAVWWLFASISFRDSFGHGKRFKSLFPSNLEAIRAWSFLARYFSHTRQLGSTYLFFEKAQMVETVRWNTALTFSLIIYHSKPKCTVCSSDLARCCLRLFKILPTITGLKHCLNSVRKWLFQIGGSRKIPWLFLIGRLARSAGHALRPGERLLQ